MVEINREVFQTDPVWSKLYDTIKRGHKVAGHTQKILIKNKHVKDFCEQLEKRIRNVCEFEARLTWCAGDGHLVLNEETSQVATLRCLIGRSSHKKLTETEHLKFCI